VSERSLAFPAHLFRWLMMSAAVGAFFTAMGALLRRATQPALPRMSDEWLNAHSKDTSYFSEY
jgi:hypothetical protein